MMAINNTQCNVNSAKIVLQSVSRTQLPRLGAWPLFLAVSPRAVIQQGLLAS